MRKSSALPVRSAVRASRWLVTLVLVALIPLVGLPPSAVRPAVAVAQSACPEPNDTRQSACFVELGAVEGVLERTDDADVYRVDSLDFGVGAQLRLAFDGPTEASATLRLLGWGDRVLGEASAADGVAELRATLPAPGAYYVAVQAAGPLTAPATYRLNLDLNGQAAVPSVLYRNGFRAAGAVDWIEPITSPHQFRVADGGLLISPGAPDARGVSFRVFPGQYGDFTITVDGVIEEGWDANGDTGLLIGVRNQPRTAAENGPSDDYWIDVESAGRLLASVRQYESRQWLMEPAPPSHPLGPGEAVRITVRMQGQEIEVFLNGASVMHTTDPMFSAGRIALGAYTNGSSMRARFDDLLITTPTVAQVSGPLSPGIDRTPGAVLYADTFADPASSRIRPTTAPGPTERAFVDNELAIRIVDPAYPRMPFLLLPLASDSAVLEADVRIVGDTEGRFAALICRDQLTERSAHYRLGFSPSNGRFTITWWDSGVEIPRVPWTESAAIRRGNEVNRVELGCTGATIFARFNGVEVARVSESAFPNGRIGIAGGVFTVNKPATSDVRFSNVIVRQL